MQKNFLSILIILFICKYTCSYIVFNLELLPKENYNSLYELNSPKDIISKEIISSYYTEIEVGTDFQKIPLIIKPKLADFVIASIHQMENPEKDYTNNRYVYNLSPNFLQNHNFFNEEKSSSYKFKNCEKRSPIDEFEKPLAEQACIGNDTYILYTDKDLKEKKILKEFYLELGRNAKDNITGVIGLNLHDMFNHASLISKLKENKLIDNYFWFFDFEKWNSNKGKLIIGAMPHDIYGNKYSKDYLVSTSAAGEENYIFYQIIFDSIYYKNSTTGEKEIIGKDEKTGLYTELNIESNVILGKRVYRDYLNISLKDLLINNQCFFDTLENYNEKIDRYYDYDFFYCHNTKEIKEKLNKVIHNIYFYSRNLNYDFELTKEQILVENGEYIYIYIIFCHQYNSWYLGKQISLKYQFVFNPDTRNVYFYKNHIKKEEKDENNYLVLKIIGIIALCIIFAVLGIILGKKIYGMRKKRANELKDDGYEYFSENKDNTLGNNI